MKLVLSGNQIGDEGAKALAKAVGVSGSLVTLVLYSNQIGDEGAKALAAGVASSGSLAELQRKRCSVVMDGPRGRGVRVSVL